MTEHSTRDIDGKAFGYVVVGAGPTGVAAARVLAHRAGPGEVLLINAEDCIPYERPSLSKAALTSTSEPIPRICSAEEFEALGVIYVCGTEVTEIRRGERRLITGAGSTGYGRLLLATGSTARALRVKGDHLPEIFYLRSASDAKVLRDKLSWLPRIGVIGGGFIGLEVAATARAMGCDVTVVTRDSFVMKRCLPAQIAIQVSSQLEGIGLELRFNVQVVEIAGAGKVEGMRLSDGQFVPVDIIVIGIGSVPNSGLAVAAGLEVDDGIIVDDRWRTSDPCIFAAGDVARRISGHGSAGPRGERLECWEPAMEHGQLAAAAMLGDPMEEPSAPWMWSDQDDINIQIVGNPRPGNPLILRNGSKHASLIAAFLEDGRLTGAITLNDGASMPILRRAINEGRSVDAGLLADAAVELRHALGMRRRA